jgi:hypothetical protein
MEGEWLDSLQILRRYDARRRSDRAHRSCDRIAEDTPLPAAEKLWQPGKNIRRSVSSDL